MNLGTVGDQNSYSVNNSVIKQNYSDKFNKYGNGALVENKRGSDEKLSSQKQQNVMNGAMTCHNIAAGNHGNNTFTKKHLTTDKNTVASFHTQSAHKNSSGKISQELFGNHSHKNNYASTTGIIRVSRESARDDSGIIINLNGSHQYPQTHHVVPSMKKSESKAQYEMEILKRRVDAIKNKKKHYHMHQNSEIPDKILFNTHT